MHKKACRRGIFMQRRLMQSLIYMREWKGPMAWTFVHKVLTVMQLITGTQINWLLIQSKMTCDGRHLAENDLFGATMRDDDDLLFDETLHGACHILLWGHFEFWVFMLCKHHWSFQICLPFWICKRVPPLPKGWYIIISVINGWLFLKSQALQK